MASFHQYLALFRRVSHGLMASMLSFFPMGFLQMRDFLIRLLASSQRQSPQRYLKCRVTVSQECLIVLSIYTSRSGLGTVLEGRLVNTSWSLDLCINHIHDLKSFAIPAGFLGTSWSGQTIRPTGWHTLPLVAQVGPHAVDVEQYIPPVITHDPCAGRTEQGSRPPVQGKPCR